MNYFRLEAEPNVALLICRLCQPQVNRVNMIGGLGLRACYAPANTALSVLLGRITAFTLPTSAM